MDRFERDSVHWYVARNIRIFGILLAALVVLPLLFACQAPASFNDRLGAAYSASEALSLTVYELCAPRYDGGPCTGTLSTDRRDAIYYVQEDALALLAEAQRAKDATLIQQARQVLAIAMRMIDE
jgi:hypothetical protein